MIPAVVSSWGSVKAAAAAVEKGWRRRWGFLVRWLRRREVNSFEVIENVEFSFVIDLVEKEFRLLGFFV